VVVYQGNVSDNILSGEKKSLVTIQIPSQIAVGTVLLIVQVKDSDQVIKANFRKLIQIEGLHATLEVKTDKEAYLKTELVTGMSKIMNGQLGIEDGILNIVVNRFKNQTAGQFVHFLPRKGWGSFRYPSGVAIGPDGSMYVVDSYNNRVQKYDVNGNFVIMWGNEGVGDGEFDGPAEIGVGPDGSVYVADTYNHRIQKFDSNGNFVTKWGIQGANNGQFRFPEGIAVDKSGDVYVVDSSNHRIQKFDTDGNFLMKWGDGGSGEGQFYYPESITLGIDGSIYIADTYNHRIQKFDRNGTYITKWGSFCPIDPDWDGVPENSCNDGQFAWPGGITVGPDGSVYVTDRGNDRIQRFDGNGTFITKWGTTGSGIGEMDSPIGIDASLDGSVYVVDGWNNRVQKFDGNGNFIMDWSTYGSNDGQFKRPVGIAISPGGSIYVADTENYRIQTFDKNGNFIKKWDSYNGNMIFPDWIASASDGSIYLTDFSQVLKFDNNGNFITAWGSYGTGNGQFEGAYGVAVGPDDSVYVTEARWLEASARVQKFDKNGLFITQWEFDYSMGEDYIPPLIAVGPDGSVFIVATFFHEIQKYDQYGNIIMKWGNYGDGDGQFIFPTGIAVGRDGFVYVVDTGNHRIQKFDSDGIFITKWGHLGSGSGEFFRPQGIAVGSDGTLYVADTENGRIQRIPVEGAVVQKIFETSYPINQLANTTQDFSTEIGLLNATGKFSLEATLTNNLGQTLSKSVYPFYVFEGDTVLKLRTDRVFYRPGEMVTITGQVEHHAPVEASGLTFSLLTKNSPPLYTETFNIPAGGSYPFVVTTMAGVEGTMTLTGRVSQNNALLVEISDQYEVANPSLSVSVTTPDLAGDETFILSVEVNNIGKVDATVQLGINAPGFSDLQSLTTFPGETKVVQFSQQISENVTYVFTFTGDLTQTITRTVSYGLGVLISMNPFPVYPGGNITVPVIVTNTGQLAENVQIDFELNPGNLRRSKTYLLPMGENITDNLYFELAEGDFLITAMSQSPPASAQVNFSVKKEKNVEIDVSTSTPMDGFIPVNVSLINTGYGNIDGHVQLSVLPLGGVGQAVWSAELPIVQLLPQSSGQFTFNIHPSSLGPGNYIIKLDLLDNGGQLIGTRSLPYAVRAPVIRIVQLPGYQTFSPGQEAVFTFRVKNTGNQEGSFRLTFKSYDLIASTKQEWLKGNEETSITFNVLLPSDLEEKDYFADYELTSPVEGLISKGQVKYHLAGINLSVNASLNKLYYTDGETARLTVNLQTLNLSPQNLSTRVHYAGYESQQTFTLSGSQVLIFDLPLPRITGEKLFYGIYHEGGRSIHLNSLYVHKAGDIITITTDKQVYNPGEIVSVSVSGNASGNMTLSGPGGYSESFGYTGLVTKSFNLPSTMVAGTYFINAVLEASNPGTITISHPFDIAGIQVKVLECQNDKGKYAASDTIITNLTVSSNTTLQAVLKFWVVNPIGENVSAGEQNIPLSSSENLITTYTSALSTSVSGIHRLVYGIYGPEDMLLCSGSEAFDVGDAVLMGLATDKRDYPINTDPVTIEAKIYGSVNADLQLELDGTIVELRNFSVNGFTTYTTQLQNITPGPHTIKGTLVAGGLQSTKETSFTYALAYVPKPQISALPGSLDFGNLNIGSTFTQAITLSSTGNADLAIGMIALSGMDRGEFSIYNDTCSSKTISPSGSCTIDVLFAPNSLGTKNVSLSIPSNAIDRPTLHIPLGGIGVATLNISINPTDSGRVTGKGIDCPGKCSESFSESAASIQLSAVPMEGYQFVNWAGGINSPDNPITITMDGHKNVAANFAINIYTITSTASPGGIISPSGSVAVNHGISHTFLILPNVGYYVADVKVDGVSVGAATVYTFNNITTNHTIEAFFVINQYTLTATAGENGTIFPLGAITVNYGASQTFTITPKSDYHTADVKVDGISIGVVTTFTFDNITSNHSIEVTFEVANHPPVADAGPDKNVITAQMVTLNGSESYDPEGCLITFLWTFVEIPTESNVTDASFSDVASPKPEFIPDINGTYRIKLIVSDGELQDEDEVAVFASPPNVAPNANAGPDQNVLKGQNVTLDGSKSNDPDMGPQPLAHLWGFVSLPVGSGLSDSDIIDRNRVKASFIPDVNGFYVLRLIVRDGELSSEDTVQITATTPNVPPNANAGNDININLGGEAVLDASASNDPDHGPESLTYLWTFVSVPAGSQLNNNSILGANTISPSFTPDVAGVYVLQLMAFDGKDTDFDNVAVTVIIPQFPPATNAMLSPLPNALGWNNSNVTVTLNATDNSGSGIKEITYSASGAQSIPSTTVAGSSVSVTISAEGQTTVTFFAKDNAGNLEAPKIVLINLDKTAPAISCRANPNLLWPPNHRMVRVTVAVDISDQGPGPAEFQLMSVVSNEPDNGLGDGDQPNDIQGWVVGSPGVTGRLRAERSGQGRGRIYTLTYRATDQAGNHSTCTTTVVVPHDMRK